MPDEHLAGEAMSESGFRNDGERGGGGVGAFVDVKVEVPSLARGQGEENVQRFLKPRDHIGDGPEQF